MAGHQIGNQILLLSDLLGYAEKLLTEVLVYRKIRLSHAPQDRRRAMLGRHLQLPADVVSHQLYKKAVVGIQHQIIKPDTRADKDLFDLR